MRPFISSSVFVVSIILLPLIGTIYAEEMGLLREFISPAEQMGGGFGWSITSPGDMNGDGCSDLIVAAYGESLASGPESCGNVYLLDGSDGTVLQVLSSPFAEESGFFGLSVSSVEDIDGGSLRDILVGACYESSSAGVTEAGRAYAFSSETGALIHMFESPNPVVRGYFGISVGGCSDLNNDGWPEMLIGGSQENADTIDGAGLVYIFDGKTGAIFDTVRSPNMQPYGHFGRSVSKIEDIDGDDIDDLLMGAPWEGDDNWSCDGRAYVISGSSREVIHELRSPNPYLDELLGTTISPIGDIDDDGIHDIIVGAPHQGEGSSLYRTEGNAYVYSGKTGMLIHELASPNPEMEGHFGTNVAGGGDFNSDGIPDIIIGADPEDLSPALENAGRAYIFSGTNGSLLFTLTSPNQEHQGAFGTGVAFIHDVNADGRPDLAVGAPYEDPGLAPLGAGRAYTFTPGLLLEGDSDGVSLAMSWTPIVSAHAYWLYGSVDSPYFLPQLEPPFEHRVRVLSPGASSTSWTDGIGDPEANWSFVLVAVDEIGEVLSESNRFGEYEYLGEVPR